jgi:signal peptidase I
VINRLIDRQDAEPQLLASVESPLKGTGRYELTLANVDKRLCLWVNDELVPLGDAVEFNLPLQNEPTVADLTPVGVAARDLTGSVSELILQRDIYYRNDTIEFGEHQGVTMDGMSGHDSPLVTEIPKYESGSLTAELHSPRAYAQRYLALTEQQQQRLGSLGDYQLNDDEYLMFGDNSPASKDSRLFDYYNRPMQGRHGHRYAVHQSQLIGEALLIFWPHGVPFLNGGQGFSVMNHREQISSSRGVSIARGDYPMYRFPFYPNVSRMKRIR